MDILLQTTTVTRDDCLQVFEHRKHNLFNLAQNNLEASFVSFLESGSFEVIIFGSSFLI
jgi:hypothetical protein